MTLDVIGAGFGRTGTTSLKAALERLDLGPCEHMQNVLTNPERLVLWNEAVRAKQHGGRIDWDHLFRGYRATTDWPGAWFWRELVRAYPEAKVILTVRDPEEWYESVRRTVFLARGRRGPGWAADTLTLVASTMSPFLAHYVDLVENTIWQGTFEGRFADRAFALQVYNAHIAAVERSVAPERLLVFNVADGWEPLCRFLDKPVPAEPFPRLNDQQEMARNVRQQVAPALAAAAGAVLTAGGLAALAWSAARKADSGKNQSAASKTPPHGS